MDTGRERELYASFLEDGEEYIQTINRDLLELEKEPADENAAERIFRTAHSLKSEASYLGEKEIAEEAHTVESLLEEARGGGGVSAEAVSSLFSTADKLTEMIGLRRSQRRQDTAGQDTVEQEPAVPGEGPAAAEAGAEEDHPGRQSLLKRAEQRRREYEELHLPEFSPLEKRLLTEARDRGEEFFRISIDLEADTSMSYAKGYLLLNNLEQLVQVIRSEPAFGGEMQAGGGEEEQQEPDYRKLAFFCTGTIDRSELYRVINIDQVAGIRISPLDYSPVLHEGVKKPAAEEYVPSVSVRVAGEDIEEMNGYIDELKIRAYRLRRYYDSEGEPTAEERSIPYEQVEVLTELADGLERLARKVRTVRLKEVLEPHRRLIRDLAKEVRKRVELVIEGQEVTVDRRAAEIISELSVHLLRNAVVHGIESPEQRQEAGKEPQGRVTIHVDRSDEYLFVQVADDGRGIDEESLQRRAEELGITEEETGEKPLLAYLVYPGVTTQQEASEYSGRGYGLDLVYKKLRQLQDARLEVENEPGRGAAFTLILPAGFALTALQMVRFGDRVIAVPKKHIQRRETPDPEGFSRGEKGDLLWQGIPVYTPEGRLYHTGNLPPQHSGLLLEYLEKKGLLLVDELLFEKEIPEERLILYIEGNPYLHRMAVSGNETTFSYLSPSILATQ